MTTKNLIFAFIGYLLFICSSCSSDDQKDSIQETSLLGTWLVESYENTDDNSITSRPAEETSIIIVISEKNISGTTSSNEFEFDEYSLMNSNTLIFEDFLTTEAGETEWGERFYNSINAQLEVIESVYEIPFEVDGSQLSFTLDSGLVMNLTRQ
ncbi:hypothetical protein [Croceiramulus getboli]|nr:hypothetical protein P8624_03380 [Flavobacteriaceae bacterium YJPT1-3]